MNLTIISAAQRSTNELVETFNRAFDGYVGGTIQLTAESFHHFVTSQGVNLALSCVACSNDQANAIALVARRGWTSRLVGMGVVPEFKNQGVGKQFMQALIQEAKDRYDHLYELEVIEQNPAGLRLYQRVGFTRFQRLIEMSCQAPQGLKDNNLTQIDIPIAAAKLIAHAAKDTPWQVSGYNLVTLGEPNVAHQLDKAYVILSNPQQETIRIQAVIVEKEARGQGRGTHLLQALFAEYPKKTWRIPALCPESFMPFFEQLGFEVGKLSQFHMRLPLS